MNVQRVEQEEETFKNMYLEIKKICVQTTSFIRFSCKIDIIEFN